MFRDAVDKIAELKGRVKRFKGELSRNETLTRYLLIDPFLRLLGWDTENPTLLRPEFSTQVSRGEPPQPLQGIPLGKLQPKLGSKMKYTEIVFPDGRRYPIKWGLEATGEGSWVYMS